MRSLAEVLSELSETSLSIFNDNQQDNTDVVRITDEVIGYRQAAFQDEIDELADGLDSVDLPELSDVLPDITQQSEEEAEGIADSFNLALAFFLLSLGGENLTPSQIRVRVSIWQLERSRYKDNQIKIWSEGTGRSLAQERFFRANSGLKGTAELFPKSAAEPICQGWIARGKISIDEAVANPAPYHQNCPHYWEMTIR